MVSTIIARDTDHANVSTLRYLAGMMIATTFCLVYFFAPLYIISSIVCLVLRYPTTQASILYTIPLFLSIVVPPIQAPRLLGWLSPMTDYFQFQEEFDDFPDDEIRKQLDKGKKFIFSFQPHGVLTLAGMTAGTVAAPDLRPVKSAAAWAVLHTPILKHVLGIFGLIDASKASLIKHFEQNSGVDGCLIIYVGGIAELFKACETEERLFLKKRKGFIKLALRLGVDVVPCFMFGNTSVLTVLKSGPLASLSRKLQVSLTYFWGRWYLPIPRDDKLLYARGKPLGLPHIPNPTDEDVNKWHEVYCKEVSRIFHKYKEKLPKYKHKQLFID